MDQFPARACCQIVFHFGFGFFDPLLGRHVSARLVFLQIKKMHAQLMRSDIARRLDRLLVRLPCFPPGPAMRQPEHVTGAVGALLLYRHPVNTPLVNGVGRYPKRLR